MDSGETEDSRDEVLLEPRSLGMLQGRSGSWSRSHRKTTLNVAVAMVIIKQFHLSLNTVTP